MRFEKFAIDMTGTETMGKMYVKSGKLLKIRFLELVIAFLHDIVVALAQSTRNPRFLSQELIIRN